MVAVRHGLALLFAAGALALGCDAPLGNSVFSNNGGLCFLSTPTGSVKLRVTFPSCLSGCETPVVAVCAMKQEGFTLRVGSRGELEHGTGDCTGDCRGFFADCESKPLAPGTYTVVHGESSGTLVLPTTGQTMFTGTGFESCPE